MDGLPGFPTWDKLQRMFKSLKHKKQYTSSAQSHCKRSSGACLTCTKYLIHDGAVRAEVITWIKVASEVFKSTRTLRAWIMQNNLHLNFLSVLYLKTKTQFRLKFDEWKLSSSSPLWNISYLWKLFQTEGKGQKRLKKEELVIKMHCFKGTLGLRSSWWL